MEMENNIYLFSHRRKLAQAPKPEHNCSPSWWGTGTLRASQWPAGQGPWGEGLRGGRCTDRVSCGLGFLIGVLLAPLPRGEGWQGRRNCAAVLGRVQLEILICTRSPCWSHWQPVCTRAGGSLKVALHSCWGLS